MRKIILSVILSLMFVSVGYGQSIPAKPINYVTDIAAVLNNDLILDSIMKSVDSTVQIALVTLPTIGSKAPVDVAVSIGRTWGVGHAAEIGDPRRNNGAVVLIVPKGPQSNRGHCFIASGKGVEGWLTDGVAGKICRSAIPYFKSNDYNGGAAFIVSSIIDLSPPPGMSVAANSGYSKSGLKVIFLIVAGGMGLFVIVVTILILRGRAKEKAEQEEYRKWEAKRAKEMAIEKEKRMAKYLAQQKEYERQKKEQERKEKERWDALTPEQQAAEIEAERIAEAKRLAYAKKVAAQEAIRQEEERKRREEEEREEEERRRRNEDTYYYGGGSSGGGYGGSSGGGGFGGFGGGGGFAGGGGGSSW